MITQLNLIFDFIVQLNPMLKNLCQLSQLNPLAAVNEWCVSFCYCNICWFKKGKSYISGAYTAET